MPSKPWGAWAAPQAGGASAWGHPHLRAPLPGGAWGQRFCMGAFATDGNELSQKDLKIEKLEEKLKETWKFIEEQEKSRADLRIKINGLKNRPAKGPPGPPGHMADRPAKGPQAWMSWILICGKCPQIEYLQYDKKI